MTAVETAGDGLARRYGAPVLMGLGVAVAGIALLLNDGTASRGDAWRLETLPLALIGLLTTLLYLALFAALHAVHTGYSPIRDAVSDYAVGSHGNFFRASLYASSVGVLALAVALGRGIGTPPVDARFLIYLLLIPVARIGMAVFPTTLEGERLNARALAHYAFAIVAFTLTYLAITDVTPILRDLSPGTSLRGLLHLCSTLVGPELAAVVVTMFRPLRKVFGLVERIFLLTTNAWFVLLALLLINRSW